MLYARHVDLVFFLSSCNEALNMPKYSRLSFVNIQEETHFLANVDCDIDFISYSLPGFFNTKNVPTDTDDRHSGILHSLSL